MPVSEQTEFLHRLLARQEHLRTHDGLPGELLIVQRMVEREMDACLRRRERVSDHVAPSPSVT